MDKNNVERTKVQVKENFKTRKQIGIEKIRVSKQKGQKLDYFINVISNPDSTYNNLFSLSFDNIVFDDNDGVVYLFTGNSVSASFKKENFKLKYCCFSCSTIFYNLFI